MKQFHKLVLEQDNFDEWYPVVETGFPSLDLNISFLRKRMLTILAARPAMGKTTLALQIAGNAAAKGKTVAFFSQRQPSMELSSILQSMMSFLPNQSCSLRIAFEMFWIWNELYPMLDAIRT